MDPPEYQEDGKLIWIEMIDLVNKAAYLICFLCGGELEGSISKERYVFVSDFLEEIKRVKAKVKQLPIQIPTSLPSYFPRTNAMGFIDYFLGNLKETFEIKVNFVPFAKYQIVAIHENLVSLWNSFKDAMRLQNENQELQELLSRIINVVYQAEYVIDSCSIIDAPIWCNLIRLSDVIQEIQFIKADVKKSRAKEMHNIRILNAEITPSWILPARATSLGMGEVIVGFTVETETIINRLTRGSSQLDIVSIVGMAGQGKTTLAKKVFDDPSVRYCFNTRAWCCVTQVHDCKELLRGLLNDLIGYVDKISDMSIEDLSHKVLKCLSGRKYLIVLDDIWDIRAWNELKDSFPNNNDGSRIMFTSRILALQAKFDSSSHLLRLFSHEESWELLQKKLFYDGICPANLSDIGQQIVKNCKGLPLAVILVAGLLARNVMNLDWWKEISYSVGSYISREGLMDIIELSYSNLPDSLKPCFLYFGAFREDQAISAQKLIRLWIAEGFIEQTRLESMEDVAKEYLMDLINRSLVNVATRSSIGWIKECHVHDLLRDFCLAKAKEEQFLHLPNVSQYSSKIRYDQYRLGIHHDWRAFIKSEPSIAGVRSLIFNGDRKRLRYSLSNPERYPGGPSFFTKFKLLKVLDLEDVALATWDFLKHITSLVHLRYLAVSGIASYIPLSIDNLRNLEVLRIKTSWNSVRLPKTIWRIKGLRHVHVNRPLVSGNIHGLQEFPKLEHMETLYVLWLDSEESAEKQLRLLPNVRELGIGFTRQVHVPLSYLLRKLDTLHVFGNWEAYCPWPFDFPSTLRKLVLNNTKLLQQHLSTIGRLPNLEVLKLVFVDFEQRTWDVEDEEFLKLKFLKLENCGVAQWNTYSESFPCIERLFIDLSHYLQELPCSFGYIITFKMVEIRHCNPGVVNSAKGILRNQFEMENNDFVVLVNGEEMQLRDEEN